MQRLLDFLYEHSLDKRIYSVLPANGAELQLSWSAEEPQHWEVRASTSAPAAQVQRAELVAHLTELGADLVLFERELGSLVAAHIVVADQMLGAAYEAIGPEGVSTVLRGQQQFVRELRQALADLLPPPRLRLVR